MTPTYEAEDELELELEDELEYEMEDELEGELEDESEFEMEWEGEDEFEGELSPIRKIYPDAMMEHLAHMAAEAESEQEAAEHFLPLIGLAAKKLLPMVAKAVSPALKRALPRVVKAVTRLEPRLTRGVGAIARKLYRQPGTRRLLHAVPSIARRTVYQIARHAAQGHPPTPRLALRTLAGQAKRVLRHGRHRRHALRRSHQMDHRLHRHLGPGAVRPHGALQPAVYGAAWRPSVARTGVIGTGVARTGGGCQCPGASAAYCRCCGQILR
jgi:hypothetical protein